MNDLGHLGVAVDVADDGAHLQVARRAEQLGLSAVWVAGGQLPRLSVLTDVLDATDSIRVGAAVISFDVHAPGDVSALHKAAAAAHPGRLVVGIGSPQRPKALPATRDAIGELDVPAGDLLLAALGPRKLELARELTGGAITLLVTPEHTVLARQILGPNRTLVVDLPVVIDDDTARARASARAMIGFLLGVAGYRRNLGRMGFRDEEIESMSDALVDAVVAHGDVATIAQRVAAHLQAGADHVMLTVLGDDDPLASLARLAEINAELRPPATVTRR